MSFMSTIIARILLCTIYALVSFHHHPFPHYLQKYSMAMFLFIVTWAKKKSSVWPWRPEALHSCDNSDSICLLFPHCLHEQFIFNSITSSLISTCFLFKYKFIFIQRKLIFSISSPDIKFMWLMWFHLSIISTEIA